MSPEEFVWWIKGLLELNELNESVKSLVEENVDVVIGGIRKNKENFTFTSAGLSGTMFPVSGSYIKPISYTNTVISGT